MTTAQMYPELTLTLTGNPEGPSVRMSTKIGVSWTLGISAVLGVPGGCLHWIHLRGDMLGEIGRPDRHRILRRARRYLEPGGILTVPLGDNTGEYPRDLLDNEAWVCGFVEGIRVQEGLAVLTRPSHVWEKTPAVSILIPAYKFRHFETALHSALTQTWPRGEIIVADDSPDQTIAGIVARAEGQVQDGWTIRYHRNQGTLGGRQNYLNLFDMASGPYIKFLNDDDLLEPDCVERMADILTHNQDITLVTSYRSLIDDQGSPLDEEAFNEPVLDQDGVLDGRFLANRVLERKVNMIGEPTTTMFRKEDLIDNRPHLMSYAGHPARRNGDVSMWMALLSRGDVAWIKDPLSNFRIHQDQVQEQDGFRDEAEKAWLELGTLGEQTGLVSPTLREMVNRPWAEGGEVADYMEKAVVAWKSGQSSGVRHFLRRAIATDRRHGSARGNLARLEWLDGNKDYAVLGAALALMIADPDPELASDLASMLITLGMPQAEAEAITAKAKASSHAVG